MYYDLLNGLKVVDLSTYIAAPVAAEMLADLGADVIKIETPKGDVIRYLNATCKIDDGPEESSAFQCYNGGKKKIVLNLKTSEGLEVMHKLLSQADVFITNNRTKSLKKMGLDYNSIKSKYPELVYGQILGYGDKGPLKDAPGFDSVAFWTRSGFLQDAGTEGDYPINAPYGFGDISTGTALFGAVCAALVKQQRQGEGSRVAVSLYGTSIWYNGILIGSAQKAPGFHATYPMKREDNSPLFTSYQSQDHKWIMLTILDYDKYFKSLCNALNLSEIPDDPRFNTYNNLNKNRKEMIRILEEAFGKFTADEISQKLTELDITHDIMPHFKDVNTDPQALENGYIEDFTFKTGKTVKVARQPIHVTGQHPHKWQDAPKIGCDTETVLKSIGYDDAMIMKLRENKTI
ncbi:CoA transferase [Bombilactobacillus bombi]|uniref:CaiB/BaiF CoA transferase family protein n=1 Tax=Bombilactobacillus bombi TaxID=1303590 RepID=UPI000E596BE2|nr:CoA transferase [Bombilactobacillus bombi]AXX65419.1 CoA transferase [Bombilactobacillus bombi]